MGYPVATNQPTNQPTNVQSQIVTIEKQDMSFWIKNGFSEF